MLARTTCALALLLGSAYADQVFCGEIPLPSDVSVSLTAEPNTGLETGDTITFGVSVTNLGPEPIDAFVVSSSFFHDEFDVYSLTVKECEGGPFSAVVVDYIGGGWDYYLHWYPALPPSPMLDVGETLRCRFSLSLTDTAPAVYPFSFDLGGSFVDLDPSNNAATVTLRRAAPAGAATPVPMLSPLALSILATLLAGMAGRRRPRVLLGYRTAPVNRNSPLPRASSTSGYKARIRRRAGLSSRDVVGREHQ